MTKVVDRGPPPGAAERRKDKRVEIYASVEIQRGDEIFVLAVVNLSLGGVLLAAGDGDDLGGLSIGRRVEVTVFDRENPAHKVDIIAHVARREPHAVALSWDRNDQVIAGLLHLMEHAARGA
jgi:hypothetical protein